MLPRIALLVLGSSLLVLGCGDDDAGDEGPAVDDVQTLAVELGGIADGCNLEYEGLVDDQREVSICTLGDEIAELSVWSDDAALDTAIESVEGTDDPLVVGQNWTIDVRGADLAEEIAEATGGTVHS